MLPTPGIDGVRELPARTFRRLLSGSPDERTPWLDALERPGDAGWYGPGSAIWQVHGSLTGLVGGIRALLLQTVHPLALAGIVQHSSYREDPLGRLQRTAYFMAATTYGTTEHARASVRALARVHETVRGTAPDGRPYSANDPHLLLWVHVTTADSMLTAYQALASSPLDADAYVADMAVIAREMGIPDPPTDRGQLREALEGFRPELRADRTTRDVAGFLLLPPLPLPVQPAYQVLAGTAVDLLPRWCGKMLGIWRRPGPVRAANRAATAAVLAGLGAVVGDMPPAQRAALARIGAAS